MDKALNYLALARKAGKAELGEEPVNAVTRAGKAPLVVVAKDASDHTWRRALSFVAGTAQQCLRLPCSKEEMGRAIGREALAIAAVTDPALALALAKSLTPVPEQAVQALEDRANRARQRQKEAKAHVRNRQLGKPRRSGEKKEH